MNPLYRFDGMNFWSHMVHRFLKRCGKIVHLTYEGLNEKDLGFKA